MWLMLIMDAFRKGSFGKKNAHYLLIVPKFLKNNFLQMK